MRLDKLRDALRASWGHVLLATTVAVTGVVSVVADLTALDTLFSGGGRPLLRVPSMLVVLVCAVILWVKRGLGKVTRAGLWTAMGLGVVLVLAAPLIVPEPAQAGTEPATATSETSTSTITTTDPTISTPPPRTTAQWALEINDICREHLSNAGLSLASIRNTTTQLEVLTNKYDFTNPAAAQKYVDALAAEVGEVLPAFVDIDVAYSVINDSAASIEPPSDPTQQESVGTWLGEYQERADKFSNVTRELGNFVGGSDNLSRAIAVGIAFFNSSRYADMTPGVLDHGEQLGIVSCP